METFIEITQGSRIDTRTAKSGNPYSKQVAYLHLAHEPYPREIKIFIDSPAHAFAAGRYALTSESFSTNEYGDIKVKPSLRPLTDHELKTLEKG